MATSVVAIDAPLCVLRPLLFEPLQGKRVSRLLQRDIADDEEPPELELQRASLRATDLLLYGVRGYAGRGEVAECSAAARRMGRSTQKAGSMKTAAVINVSHPHYNLGAAKLSNWLRSEGWTVTEFGGDPGMFGVGFDLVALSVIFTWDATTAREIAWRVSGSSEVWAGGPGLFRLQDWWKRETGLDAHVGLDQRFERQPGDYRMVFAARGCPVGCFFCIVPKLEGLKFTLNWDFKPVPILCDNNLSALPVHFQDHILSRYADVGVPILDANSGFEPKYFDHATYWRWNQQLRGPWRFAFDQMPEWRSVSRMMNILRPVAARKKQVYVLIGNEPIDSCYERAMKVIEWGGEPYCQPEMALDTLDKEPKVRHDWTSESLRDFARFFNRRLWRSMKIGEYMPRKFEKNPFLQLVLN